MRPLQIHEAIKKSPFRQFVLRTMGSQEYVVPHPEYAALHPDERVVIVFGPSGEMNVLDTMLIESLDYLDDTDTNSASESPNNPDPGSNGVHE